MILDANASEAVLARATERLHSGGAVSLVGVCVLRPTADRLFCDVPDPDFHAHRCDEERAVLIENARRALADSALAARLPDREQVWRVVPAEAL